MPVGRTVGTAAEARTAHAINYAYPVSMRYYCLFKYSRFRRLKDVDSQTRWFRFGHSVVFLSALIVVAA